MAPRPKPRPRRDPDVLPDSLPKRGEEPDVLPDDLRRTDQPDMTPDSLPRRGDPGITDTRPDGGVAQHPIHDEGREDMDPEDYEREMASALAAAPEPVTEEAQEVERTGDEFDAEELGPGSSPAQDRDR